MAAAAEVGVALSPIGDMPANEAQARELVAAKNELLKKMPDAEIEGYRLGVVQVTTTAPIRPGSVSDVLLDKVRVADFGGNFNFATWFDTGYWEYMNHSLGEPNAVVVHGTMLPEGWTNIFLVIPTRLRLDGKPADE